MLKIGIDAGHGFNTSGKRTPDGEREWTFNDKLVKAFISEMAKYQDVEVKRFDDATGKTDIPLKKRTDDSNSFDSDLYISFHHNGLAGKWGSHGGVETHVYKTKPVGSVKLAEAVHPALVKAYGLKDRGIKYSDLHITRETKCDSILIEGGFMDSTVDIVKLRDDKVLAEAGKSIAQAVAVFKNLKLKPVPVAKPVVKPASKPVAVPSGSYSVVAGDSLSKIGVKFGLSVAELKALNGLKTDLIKVGQVLKVKKVVAPKPAPKPVQKVAEVVSDVWLHNKAVYTDASRVRVLKKGERYKVYGEVNGMFNLGNSFVSKKFMKLI